MRPSQRLQPCARCEQELPESYFPSPQAVFCKRCNEEVNKALRRKYSIIKAAHFRAQLRHSARQIEKGSPARHAAVAAVGD